MQYENGYVQIVPESEMTDETASGTWGGLLWSYANGVLTVTGVGDMDTTGVNEYPWSRYASHITSVVLKGISSVAHHAFADCENLLRATLPESLSDAQNDAFGGEILDVYYSGGERDWDDVTLRGTDLAGADVHYNALNVYTTGDVNFDGSIGVEDAFEILRYYAENAVSGAGSFSQGVRAQAVAEIDGDDAIAVSDARLVLTYYALASSGLRSDWDEILK